MTAATKRATGGSCSDISEVTCGKLLSSPPKHLILCKLNKAIQK